MRTLIVNQYLSGLDSDAATYIAAVEAADGQTLEGATKTAINDFVVGCKADGIWDAIKASCILAGARTLDGALTPLVGAAPTNFNFVEGDYNRKTGLKRDGTTKYLNANRAGNADPQDDYHLAVFRTQTQDNSQAQIEIGYGDAGTGASSIFRGFGFDGYVGTFARCRNSSSGSISNTPRTVGLHAISRSAPSLFTGRANGSSVSISIMSQVPSARATLVFSRSLSSSDSPNTAFSLSRLSFYSIGESLDLALLDARVTQLMTDINNAF